MVESEMLLDNADAELSRKHAREFVGGVIRQTDWQPEGTAQRLYRAQIGILRLRRVGDDAMQEDDLLIALARYRLHHFFDLAQCAHTGRHDHRATLARDL